MSDLSDAEIHALQVQGDHTAVLEALSDLTEARVDKAHRGIMKGISMRLSGQTDEALLFLMLASLNEVQEAAQTSEMKQDVAMALLLTQQVQPAITLLRDLVEAGTEDAVVYGRLATAYLGADDLDGALENFREAVARETGRVEWHSNLGGVLVRQQRLEEALDNYDAALRIDPDFEKAKLARESVLKALGRADELLAQLQKDVTDHPELTSARLKYARALARENQRVEAFRILTEALLPFEEVSRKDPEDDSSAEAVATEREVLSSAPGQVALRVCLSEIAMQLDMYGRALAATNEVLALDPENPVRFIRQRVSILIELNMMDDAEDALDAAEEEHGDVTPLRMARAQYYSQTDQHDKAEALQRELLETYPGDAQLMLQLGQSLLLMGKLDEAARLFEEAADMNPMAFAQMVNAKHVPDDPMILEKMKKVADNTFLPDDPRISMSFALAEVFEKQKDFDTAFHYLRQANEMSDKTLNFNADAFEKRVDAQIAFFTKDFLYSQEPIRPTFRTPIFVVGMPRSGTTLTEQILCSHPKVFGAGELGLMSKIVGMIPGVLKTKTPYPKCLTQMPPQAREQAARFYLRGLDALDKEHPYVVDKMPHNFMNVGLISMIMPRAKIIHIRRDPRDNGLSNYQQNFKAKHGGLGYSFNLEKTARHLNDYHRMMRHWQAVLPVPMFEMTYEELVADQEGMTRQLLDFIGLDWSDSVRDFHKTERAVRTASVAQVRQKIYQSSKQKWRGYERHLAPLLDNLKPETTALWDHGQDMLPARDVG